MSDLTCSVLLGEQRTPEWFEARRGVFTASGLGKFVLESTKTARKAINSMIDRTLADALTPLQTGTEDAPDFSNYWMRRGVRLEPEARIAYENKTGNRVEEVAFCLHESGMFGCSPDGLVNDREGGLEIKCPQPERHIAYIRAGVLPEQYEMQVHSSMAVTGLPWWDFWSYCPSLPPLLVRVHRSDLTERIVAAMIDHGTCLAFERQRIADMWNREFEPRTHADGLGSIEVIKANAELSDGAGEKR